MAIGDSFEPGNTATGPAGQRAHPEQIAHLQRLQLKLHSAGDSTWSLVGNGLLADGSARVSGDADVLRRLLGCLDLAGFAPG